MSKFAIGAIVALLFAGVGVSAMAFAGGGGSGSAASPEEVVKDTWKATADGRWGDVCDNHTKAAHKEMMEGEGAIKSDSCEAAMALAGEMAKAFGIDVKESLANHKVTKVTINGNRATVKVDGDEEVEDVELVRENGRWLINSL